MPPSARPRSPPSPSHPPQHGGAHTRAGPDGALLNFCSNNYLGLSNHPGVVAAAHAALGRRGYGLSSVRFICGTQDVHTQLEAALSTFHGTAVR